jgi:hypothetical protein
MRVHRLATASKRKESRLKLLIRTNSAAERLLHQATKEEEEEEEEKEEEECCWKSVLGGDTQA